MADGSSHPFSDARTAGLSPIPVDTTTKRPKLAWKQYQESAAEELACIEWDQAGHNIGVVCGAVSGRLICIDIEGALMERIIYLDPQAHALLTVWSRGYLESTPSGGFHVLIRLEGVGPTEGNRKLAMSADGKVLVETRAEGGYVITAPSRNGHRGWELKRGGFDEICWATQAEWEIVAAALGALDETPPPTMVVPTSTETPAILRLGDSWIDDELARLPTLEHLLVQYGWVAVGADEYGQHWVRPGKNPRDGHSASLSHEGRRLYVHSTNAGLPVGDPTLDALDVILAYGLGRRPSRDERVDWLRQRKSAPPPLAVGVGAAGQEADSLPAQTSLNLPDEFWQSRPYLAHIYQAALANRVSPDAVWEAIKCFYASLIPWNHRLPGDGTLDYISINVGMSGAGKTRAKHVAYGLLTYAWNTPGVCFPSPIGTGEGMTEIFLDRKNEDFKYRGVGFYSDEGRVILDLNSRVGNTTVQAMKQLWSGELTGSVAATADRHRFLAPRAVRAAVLVSVTPEVAAEFLRRDLTDEGLPQRISWGWAHYPHPDERPDDPGPLVLEVWNTSRSIGRIVPIELEGSLAAMIDARQLAMSRGETVDGWEGHAVYAIEKAAGIHAHLDCRLQVTQADWDLGQVDWEITRKIRAHILSRGGAKSADRAIAAGTARAHEKIAELNVYLEKAAISVARKVSNSTGPVTMRQLKDHLRAFARRHGVDHREAVDAASLRGWVVIHSDGSIGEGPVKVGGVRGS